MASPTHGKEKITPKVLGSICTSIESGNYVETACLAAGVTRATFDQWISKGNEDAGSGDKTVYSDFLYRIEEARAKAEVYLLEKVKEGGKGWQAYSWVLERTRNDRFGQKQTITQNIDLKVPAVAPEAPKTYRKWLERRLERTQLQGEEAEFTEVNEDADKLSADEQDIPQHLLPAPVKSPTQLSPAFQPLPPAQENSPDSEPQKIKKIPHVTKAQTSAHLLRTSTKATGSENVEL